MVQTKNRNIVLCIVKYFKSTSLHFAAIAEIDCRPYVGSFQKSSLFQIKMCKTIARIGNTVFRDSKNFSLKSLFKKDRHSSVTSRDRALLETPSP